MKNEIYFILGIVLSQMSLCHLRAADSWIFSGQSNMRAIGGAAKEAVGKLVKSHGREYYSIYSAASGKPIEAWLDPKHHDYKLWISIEEQVGKALKAGHQIKGFIWYQGESNTRERAGKYQQQLGELVRRIRKLTGDPNLPAIIVQIGSATSYSGRDWAAATIREAQRRFAGGDKNAAVVAAIDAEVGDYTVHLSREGAKTVSARIAAAADRLAYGNEKAYWGPQFKQAYFGDPKRRLVIVEFDEVQGELELGKGWLAGFGVSTKTKLPERLWELEDATKLGQLTDDYIYPVGGQALGKDRLVLAFAQSLPESSRVSYAASRNAQYGPHRLWGLEFAGVRDESGHQAPAFALVPIKKAKGKINITVKEVANPISQDWEQIAVNCVGRFPPAVTKPDVKAGVEQGGWRQAYWNPVSAGSVPNLFDSKGQVTPVGFETGVWYMSPYFRELESGDDALMASWCKNSTHAFIGLEPKAKYDLAIYLLQGPPLRVKNPPSHRPVRVSILEIAPGKRRRDAKVLRQEIVEVPADEKFESYQVTSGGKKSQGNVLLLKEVAADHQGRIELAVEFSQQRGDSLRWRDTTLAGVQIRLHKSR